MREKQPAPLSMAPKPVKRFNPVDDAIKNAQTVLNEQRRSNSVSLATPVRQAVSAGFPAIVPQRDPLCPIVPVHRPVGAVGEKESALRDPLGALTANEAGEAAKTASKTRFPLLDGADDAQDAYRHFYWNYAMTRLLGPERAAAFANAHEVNGVASITQYGPNTAAARDMDTWNNFVARSMAVDPRYKGRPTADVADIAMDHGCLRVLK